METIEEFQKAWNIQFNIPYEDLDKTFFYRVKLKNNGEITPNAYKYRVKTNTIDFYTDYRYIGSFSLSEIASVKVELVKTTTLTSSAYKQLFDLDI